MAIDEKDFLSFVTVKEGLDKNSVRLCRNKVGLINKALGDNELNKQFVEEFFLSLMEAGRENNTLNSYRFAFRHIVNYFKDRGLPSDFFDGFKSFEKNKPDIIILTLDEIERIINTPLTYGMFRGVDTNFLDFRFRTLIMFFAYLGCRYSEAANLTVKHLDISAGKVQFVDTKNNENRTNYFTGQLKENLVVLIKDRKPEERVFRNSMETTIHASDYLADLKRRATVAGITKRVYPHIFRHSWATHMLEAGVGETQVAKLGGWKDIQIMYDVYMHLANRTLEKASRRFPLIRRSIEPNELIKIVTDTIEDLHLDEDSRISYQINQTQNTLKFELIVK